MLGLREELFVERRGGAGKGRWRLLSAALVVAAEEGLRGGWRCARVDPRGWSATAVECDDGG